MHWFRCLEKQNEAKMVLLVSEFSYNLPCMYMNTCKGEWSFVRNKARNANYSGRIEI